MEISYIKMQSYWLKRFNSTSESIQSTTPCTPIGFGYMKNKKKLDRSYQSVNSVDHLSKIDRGWVICVRYICATFIVCTWPLYVLFRKIGAKFVQHFYSVCNHGQSHTVDKQLQTRGVATGGIYRYIYPPKAVYLKFFMWLFCLLDPFIPTQIKFLATPLLQTIEI